MSTAVISRAPPRQSWPTAFALRFRRRATVDVRTDGFRRAIAAAELQRDETGAPAGVPARANLEMMTLENGTVRDRLRGDGAASLVCQGFRRYLRPVRRERLRCSQLPPRQRRRRPEEISVIGYDDIEWARYSRPALTTIHQPVQEVAHRRDGEYRRDDCRGGRPDTQ
jgi:hypothetical protein